MEVKYKRDMNRNFLILDYKNQSGYEMKMILNNRIQGLLGSQCHTFNGCAEIYYDISSRQPLDRIYTKKEMNAEDIKGVLLSLHILIKELKRYLLDSGCIIFNPQFCYCCPETRKSEWIYYPEIAGKNSMRDLAEFMIDRVAHEDKGAVDMAYRFYKMVKSDLFSIGELEAILDTYQEKEEPEKDVHIEDERGVYHFERMKDNDYRKTVTSGVDKINASKASFLSKIWDVIREKINAIYIKEGIRSEDKFKEKYNRVWESYGPEQKEDYKGETMVMGVANMTAERRLRSLSKSGKGYISLNRLPCILGKMEECADVVLNDPSVSRIHARIYEEEGELYLQDLNSRNGSYLNNLILESNETVQLKVGDEITFGNLRYVYE